MANINAHINDPGQNQNPIPYQEEIKEEMVKQHQEEIKEEMVKQLQQAGNTENLGNLSFNDIAQKYKQKFVPPNPPSSDNPNVPATTAANTSGVPHKNWFGASSYIAAMSSLQEFWKTTQNEKNFERQKTFTAFLAAWASTEDVANFQVQVGKLTQDSYNADAIGNFLQAGLTAGKMVAHGYHESKITEKDSEDSKILNTNQKNDKEALNTKSNKIQSQIDALENPKTPQANETVVTSQEDKETQITKLNSQKKDVSDEQEALEKTHAGENQSQLKTQYERAQTMRASTQWQDLAFDAVGGVVKGSIDFVKGDLEMQKAKAQAEENLTKKMADIWLDESRLAAEAGKTDQKTMEDIQELLPTLARKFFFSRPI